MRRSTLSVAAIRRTLARVNEPNVLFPLIAVLLLALIWVSTLDIVKVKRGTTEQVFATTCQETLLTYTAQIVRSLHEIDQTLKLVKFHREHATGEASLAILNAKGLLPSDLLFRIVILDGQNHIIDSTSHAAAEESSILASMPHGTDQGMSIQRFPSEGTQTAKLVFSRPLNVSGNDGGRVLVMVDATFFVSSYDSIALGKRGLLGLVSNDGEFHVRRVGDDMYSGEEFGGATQTVDVSATDAPPLVEVDRWKGEARWTAAQQLYGLPIKAVVGLSVDEKMAAVDSEIRGDYIKSACASLLCIAFLFLLSRMSAKLALSRIEQFELNLAHAKRVEYLALHDSLTGLSNRAPFMRGVDAAIERARAGSESLFAVLFLDFDHFKYINDTLGHKAGDELLKQIAQRLKSSLRRGDIVEIGRTDNEVCRFGGDEFLVLLNDLREGSAAVEITNRLLEALAPSYIIQDVEVFSSASCGIVIGDANTASAEDVVRDADVAMYEAKRGGRACAVLFNDGMRQRVTRLATIEADLRHAIARAELRVVYQPIVDLATGAMVSAEALVRWSHPRLGEISPAEFIPIAEQSNLIVALGRWVLKEACQAMVTWREEYPDRAPGHVSVNMSPAELGGGENLLNGLRQTLSETGLPAQCLQLEITEREVTRRPEASLKMVRKLKELGVKLAMDDFGTGTSSLGMLRDHPFDTIKIDRSLVVGIATNRDVVAVIHAAVDLVENLRMASLAEGIEEEAELAVLVSIGCRFGQGYLFSRPVPKDQLMLYRAERRRHVYAETA